MLARALTKPSEKSAACTSLTVSPLGAPLPRGGAAPVAILASVGSFAKPLQPRPEAVVEPAPTGVGPLTPDRPVTGIAFPELGCAPKHGTHLRDTQGHDDGPLEQDGQGVHPHQPGD